MVPCAEVEQNSFQSKRVAERQQRFCGRNRPVCPAAVQHRSQQGPYPLSHGCLGIKPCVVVQNRNCTVAFASLMAPDECVRCLVLLQSGQEEL